MTAATVVVTVPIDHLAAGLAVGVPLSGVLFPFKGVRLPQVPKSGEAEKLNINERSRALTSKLNLGIE
ncbi:hypothetical protein [Pelomonas sp. KK5]|uniref:hypothetical protein n=1 Tax=Pelomonas sp. KK5 TaxID=1855730 RepID=UPI00097C55A1|nr:hypothetical protein [Pelomonas sp. KK5]